MAKGKSKAKIGGPGAPALVGGSAVIKPNTNTVKVPGLVGSKVKSGGRKSKGGNGTLSTLSGKSGIMNPPQGGGYA